MTNPSGLAPQAICVNTVAPLFPRGKDHQSTAGEWHDHRGGSRVVRDIQVYPRHIRETETHQHLHRTAAVKHYLRQMADRSEMLSTYEHDFGFMTRPKQRDFAEPKRTRQTSSAPPSRAGSVRSARSATRTFSGDYYADSQFVTTSSKLQGFQESGSPLRLTVTGWGDCRWSPATHPHMVMGMTQKGISIKQTTNLMKLRSPNLPFVSR